MAIRDTRLDTLAELGIMGEDAETSLAIFEARGGLTAAHEALTRQFGYDGTRVALALLAGPLR